MRVQVLLPPAEGLLGSVVSARILSASRWSVMGEVVAGEATARKQAPPQAGAELGSSGCTPALPQSPCTPAGVGTAHAVKPEETVPQLPVCGVSCACVEPGSIGSGGGGKSPASTKFSVPGMQEKSSVPRTGNDQSTRAVPETFSKISTDSVSVMGESASIGNGGASGLTLDAGAQTAAKGSPPLKTAATGTGKGDEMPSLTGATQGLSQTKDSVVKTQGVIIASGHGSSSGRGLKLVSAPALVCAEESLSERGGIVDGMLMLGVLLGLSGTLISGVLKLLN